MLARIENASLIHDRLHPSLHAWQIVVTDRSFCLPLVCFPPARPGGGPPLGHGWSRDGHDGAARSRSRQVASPRVGSRQSRRRASSLGLCRSPHWSRCLSDARLRDRSRGRSVRHVSPSPLEPPFDFRCPDGARLRSRRWSRTGRVADHVPRATLRSRLRSKTSQGLQGPLPGSSASPLSAPGSCPGGGQAIGQ
jgi:hypothetical protein